MSLFTRKGDDGKTGTFGCDQRISKGGAVAGSLGSLDEINSFLGLVKVKSKSTGVELKIFDEDFSKIIDDIQQNLFIIQSEVAGSNMTIAEEKLKICEDYINEGEKILPPIKTFFVSGGTELSSLYDISRTLARKAEREVVSVVEQSILMSENNITVVVGKNSLAYLNRLSSLLYVMARLSNHFMGILEDAPSYK
ncbi:MAG: cob(I)yrinic acid a,c-diamide adenosyltransferase [bacterium]